jgi:hypothetical protein
MDSILKLLLILLFFYYYYYVSDFFFIVVCFESLCHCCVRKEACHAAFFLKCLHRATSVDSSDSLKCLPNGSCSLKCLLYRCVVIKFRSIFLMVLFVVRL